MTEEQLAQTYEEACKNAVVYGTGFIRVSLNGPGGLEVSVVNPEDYQWLEPNQAAKDAQDRVFDLLLGDDGQAWKEAERYLERARPDLALRLKGLK
jgi:hypothetical protein